MITHTPRCDLEFNSDKGDDSPALAFARQLETELSEARAERDAAENSSAIAVGEASRQVAASDSLNRQLMADLTRLRAVADELAGALEMANRYVSWDESSLREDYEEAEKELARDCAVINAALSRYHAATTPASVAANTPLKLYEP